MRKRDFSKAESICLFSAHTFQSPKHPLSTMLPYLQISSLRLPKVPASPALTFFWNPSSLGLLLISLLFTALPTPGSVALDPGCLPGDSGLAASAPPGNSLERQISGTPSDQLTQQLRTEPVIWFNGPSRCFLILQSLENH